MWTEEELARMSEEKQRGIRSIRANIQAFKGYSEETLRIKKLMATDPASPEISEVLGRWFEESVGWQREISRRQCRKEMDEAAAVAARRNAGVHMEEAAAAAWGNAVAHCSSHGRDTDDCPIVVKRQRVVAPPTDMDPNISSVGEDARSGQVFLI